MVEETGNILTIAHITNRLERQRQMKRTASPAAKIGNTLRWQRFRVEQNQERESEIHTLPTFNHRVSFPPAYQLDSQVIAASCAFDALEIFIKDHVTEFISDLVAGVQTLDEDGEIIVTSKFHVMPVIDGTAAIKFVHSY